MFGVHKKVKGNLTIFFKVNWTTNDFRFEDGVYLSSISKEKKDWEYSCSIKIAEEIYESKSPLMKMA